MRTANDAIPVEGGAWVDFVGLNVPVGEQACGGCELVIGQFGSDEFFVLVARVGERDFGEDAVECGGEFDEGGVLGVGEVELGELLALNGSGDGLITRGAGDEVTGGEAAVADPTWECDVPAGAVLRIPPGEGGGHDDVVCVVAREGICADVGEFDAHAAVVAGGGVPGAFLHVEGLVDGAVEVDHEMDAQASFIVQRAEAASAGACGVVVDDELVDFVAQQIERPGAGAGDGELVFGERFGEAEAEAFGLGKLAGFLRGFPVCFGPFGESAFDAVGVVAALIEPEFDAGAVGVEQLAGDHDFVAAARVGGAGARCGAGGEEEECEQEEGETRGHGRSVSRGRSGADEGGHAAGAGAVAAVAEVEVAASE